MYPSAPWNIIKASPPDEPIAAKSFQCGFARARWHSMTPWLPPLVLSTVGKCVPINPAGPHETSVAKGRLRINACKVAGSSTLKTSGTYIVHLLSGDSFNSFVPALIKQIHYAKSFAAYPFLRRHWGLDLAFESNLGGL